MRISAKIFGYLLILIGLFCLVDAAYDQYRGVASTSTRSSQYIEKKADKNSLFQNLMIYQWGRGFLFFSGGLIILGICRRSDCQDPFSPNFSGSPAIDELNRSLTEEEEKRKRPLQ